MYLSSGQQMSVLYELIEMKDQEQSKKKKQLSLFMLDIKIVLSNKQQRQTKETNFENRQNNGIYLAFLYLPFIGFISEKMYQLYDLTSMIFGLHICLNQTDWLQYQAILIIKQINQNTCTSRITTVLINKLFMRKEPSLQNRSWRQERSESTQSSRKYNTKFPKIDFHFGQHQQKPQQEQIGQKTLVKQYLEREKLKKMQQKRLYGNQDSFLKFPNIASPHTQFTTNCFTEGFTSKGSQDWILKEGQYSIEQHSIGSYSFRTDEQNKQNYLGRGGYGKVFKGYSSVKEHPVVAIKVMVIDCQKTLQRCQQQALRQQLVKSDRIVKIYMSKIIPLNQKEIIFVIACELMDLGHLTIPEDGQDPKKALQKLKLILKSYEALYRRKMAHRDLKPQNILTNSKGEIKISDFGTAMEQTDKKQQKFSVTFTYASPQQLKNQEHTDKCDVFAIGCIFFQMLVGKPPRYASCITSFNRIDTNKFRAKLQAKGVPQIMISFLEGCLRQHESVEIQKDGKKVQDPSRSRMSWQDVYLHPLFDGEFNHIPREIAGSSILLTIRTMGMASGVNIVQRLKVLSEKVKEMKKQQIYTLLYKINNNQISCQEIDRLDRMYGGKGTFIVNELLDAFIKLQDEQYSNYSGKQARAFWKMFNYIGKMKQSKMKFEEIVEELKTSFYCNRKNISLTHINFTAFPLLPPMQGLKKIQIKGSQIQVLDVRLNAPSLQNLTLIYCTIERIILIRGCPNLTYVNLRSNRLRQVEGLQMLTILKFLDLAENRIRNISNINHLKFLIAVSFYNNRITSIEGLYGCDSLNQLHLEYNRIEQLSRHLLKITETKAPLNKIHLTGNSIGSTQKNKDILKMFKNQRPHSKVYLSGDDNQPLQQFQEKQTNFYFEEGIYKFISVSDVSKAIGIGRDERGKKLLKLVEENSKMFENTWFIKNVQKDEFSLLTPDQKRILYIPDSGQCLLAQYKEDSKLQENWRCRWQFVQKMILNERQAFSIKFIGRNLHMYSGSNGQVKIGQYKTRQKQKQSQQQEEKKQFLWFIEPTKMQQQ